MPRLVAQTVTRWHDYAGGHLDRGGGLGGGDGEGGGEGGSGGEGGGEGGGGAANTCKHHQQLTL